MIYIKYLISLFFFIKKSFIIFKVNYSFNIKEDDLKIIFTLPRSGTHLIEGILSSYLEQIYNKGDGSPKFFDNKLLSYNIPENPKLLSKNILIENSFLNENIYSYFIYSHYPIQKIDLIKISKVNPVVLVRDPVKSTSSAVLLYLNHRYNNKSIGDKQLDKIIEIKLLQTIRYLNFWHTKLNKSKNSKFLLIKFEDLVNNIEENIIKILKFYNLKIDIEKLKCAINFNHKDNIQKTISKYNANNLNLQFSSREQLKKREIIETKVFKKLHLTKFDLFGYKY